MRYHSKNGLKTGIWLGQPGPIDPTNPEAIAETLGCAVCGHDLKLDFVPGDTVPEHGTVVITHNIHCDLGGHTLDTDPYSSTFVEWGTPDAPALKPNVDPDFPRHPRHAAHYSGEAPTGTGSEDDTSTDPVDPSEAKPELTATMADGDYIFTGHLADVIAHTGMGQVGQTYLGVCSGCNGSLRLDASRRTTKTGPWHIRHDGDDSCTAMLPEVATAEGSVINLDEVTSAVRRSLANSLLRTMPEREALSVSVPILDLDYDYSEIEIIEHIIDSYLYNPWANPYGIVAKVSGGPRLYIGSIWVKLDDKRSTALVKTAAVEYRKAIVRYMNETDGKPPKAFRSIDLLTSTSALARARSFLHGRVNEYAFDITPSSRGLASLNTGVLDIEEGRLLDPDEAKKAGLTYRIDTAHDPTATAPVFEEFVERLFSHNPDMVRGFQKAIGGALVPKRPHPYIVTVRGEGKDGKSVVVNAITRTLGTNGGAVTSVRPESLTTTSDDVRARAAAKMDGAIVASLGDGLSRVNGKDVTVNADSVKLVAGGETVEAKKLYQDTYDVTVNALPIVMTNGRFSISGCDDGVKRRFERGYFAVDASTRGDDGYIRSTDQLTGKSLAEALEAEAPGILNWIIEGGRRFLEDGGELDLLSRNKRAFHENELVNSGRMDELMTDLFALDTSLTGGSLEGEVFSITVEKFETYCRNRAVEFPRNARVWLTARLEENPSLGKLRYKKQPLATRRLDLNVPAWTGRIPPSEVAGLAYPKRSKRLKEMAQMLGVDDPGAELAARARFIIPGPVVTETPAGSAESFGIPSRSICQLWHDLVSTFCEPEQSTESQDADDADLTQLTPLALLDHLASREIDPDDLSDNESDAFGEAA